MSEYDLISGVSGTGAYLLARHAQDGAGPEVEVALRATLRALVALTAPTADAPRWWTPHHLLNDPGMVDHYPGGVLNCGLAHGVPGPLATMALAVQAGVDVPGLADSVAGVAEWLARHRTDDQWGPNWPTVVGTAPTGRPDLARRDPPARTAWCYGAPGVARSLWLAGAALDDRRLADLAVETVLAVYRRPTGRRNIDAPTFCHGRAGLAQVTLRLAADSGRPDLAAAAAGLVRELVAGYRPDTLLGYRNTEPGGAEVDQPGLLDGATGVALVLLAAATPAEPAWDRLFLLS